MDPAKAVGGDFYDFFFTDKDHLCLVMADVSGKGIPAAMFMMNSKVMLQNIAGTCKSPAEILKKGNDTLCSNEDSEMFVTVWLGILDLKTGRIVAANAGHEYPSVRHSGGGYELYTDKHGLVLGGMEGVSYKEYEFELAPGDSLFLYTDGVPEATNSSEEMFGTDRMLEALNTDPDAAPDQILANVRKAVDEFVMDYEQFDDLTMMCIRYNGSAPQKTAAKKNRD
jgi:sigma-B regulation protein RsbU (phosphoserine phosphatase)